MPNIIEKYTEMRKGCVLLISGPICKIVKKLATHIANKFKFSVINANTYTGSNIINFSKYDAKMDWNSLNSMIKNLSSHGVVVYGFTFPSGKITRVDYHIHLSVNKTTYSNHVKTMHSKKNESELPDNKNNSVDDLKNNNVNDNQNHDKEFDVKISNKFDNYMNTINNSRINKFVKVDNLTKREIYEKVFDFIIEFINNRLYNVNQKRPNNNKNNIVNM